MRLSFFCALALLVAIVSCKPRRDVDESALNVLNGKYVDLNDYPTMASIETGLGHCSGVVVATNAIFTALHCFEKEPDIEKVTVLVRNKQYKPKDISIGPNDLAILVFDSATTHFDPVERLKRADPDGAYIEVRGVRIENNKLVMKVGTNTRYRFSPQNQFIIFRREETINSPIGENVSSEHGDSGGPMFDEDGTLVGIGSYVQKGSSEASGSLTHEDSNYSNLNSVWSRSFLSRTVKRKGALIPATCCSCDTTLYANQLLGGNKGQQKLLILSTGKADDQSYCESLPGEWEWVGEGDKNYVSEKGHYYKYASCSLTTLKSCFDHFATFGPYDY